MTFLLDVNVLIALIDPAHVSHDAAHNWFEAAGRISWATCPITENGVIRIVGHARYPNMPGSTADIATIVRKMRELPGHVFWSDSLSLIDSAYVDVSQVLTSAQVTDSYLLALAGKNGGKLATFDRRLSTRAVKGGKGMLHIIGNS
ncbi:TA system VapC family ribonuclease toxin [Inquilinus sp. CAU 1745]|uniref:TA system VapC family ribonuclease toxin n=1 Tax=Inquilinus sp. CAU 1745 TaxID=3140369 RepID=UPI00325A5166